MFTAVCCGGPKVRSWEAAVSRGGGGSSRLVIGCNQMAARYLCWCVVLSSLFPLHSFADDAPLGGFIPFVGISLTDEFKNANTDLTGTFFIADREPTLVGSQLSGGGTPYYDVALLDIGSAAHVLTFEASGPNGFDIDGNGFDGTNTQQIGGASGLINLSINDPLAIFAAGLGERTAAGAKLTMNTGGLKGQSSVATLSAPEDWALPNIVGLPMAAQYSISIKNSEPQIFTLGNRTVRTPQIEFGDLGVGGGDIIRRAPLKMRPGSSFIAGPLYVQNLDIFGGSFDFHENPLSPTVIENGGLFIDVDLADGSDALEDKEFLLDTGADLTVVSEITAKRLGFDPILDTPDFVLEVEGSAGVAAGVPGFYVDTLNIDTVGGNFTLHNVPVAVLDVTNPNDPGNIVDGIVGMHLFTGRDLVIDANPSIGQGGVGPSLFISDPVTQSHAWSSTAAQASFLAANSWSGTGVPDVMWVAEVRNTTLPSQSANLAADATVNQLFVAGDSDSAMSLQVTDAANLTVFGITHIDLGGELSLVGAQTRLDAQQVNITQGTLRGDGTVIVGSGPITGVVRNIAGRIEPGNGVGSLEIAGDFANLSGATLAIELAGTAPEDFDLLDIGRLAFLDGTLEVSLLAGYTPSVGDMFTILNTADGVTGEFAHLVTPGGFQWGVDYLANSVVLKVLGLGTAGDFDGDGDVDGQDFLIWQRNPNIGSLADWQSNLGASLASAVAIPEPASGISLVLLLAGGFARGVIATRVPSATSIEQRSYGLG